MSEGSIDQWDALLEQANALKGLLDSEDFDNVEAKAKELLASTEGFFSTIDRNDVVLVERVLAEGAEVLKLIEQVGERTSQLRSDTLNKFSNLTRGAKGVNAYKNS